MTFTRSHPDHKLDTTAFEIAPGGEQVADVPLRTPSTTMSRASADSAELGELGELAVLDDGHEVRVMVLAGNTAVVKSRSHMAQGVRTDLELLVQGRTLRGEINCVRISQLEPRCYEAIFVIDQPVET